MISPVFYKYTVSLQMDDELNVCAPYDPEINPDGQNLLQEGARGVRILDKGQQSQPNSSNMEEYHEIRTVTVTKASRKSRKTRWDQGATVSDELQKKFNIINEQQRSSHWRSVVLPQPIWKAVHAPRGAQGTARDQEKLKRRIGVLQRILFADAACGTTTPKAILDDIIFGN